MNKNLEKYFKERTTLIDAALDRFLPKVNCVPTRLHQAMRYSVFGDAKRIRPILTLAVSDLLRGNLKRALIPACALELIHSFSLVHDDLPEMDNDDFRRGRLTCHKKYGAAEALLAGDSLLVEAFRVLSLYPDPTKAARLTKILAEASGSLGMAGGQAMEKVLEDKEINLPTLNLIHVNKTGKLFLAACLAGAVSAGASKKEERHIRIFAESIGFAFQIVDDIMDRDGYLKFMSESEARAEAGRLTQKAQNALKPFGKRATLLIELAEFLGKRKK